MVEVDSVERDVEQELAHARPDQHFQVLPIREILVEELAEMPALRRCATRSLWPVALDETSIDWLCGHGGVCIGLLPGVIDRLLVLGPPHA